MFDKRDTLHGAGLQAGVLAWLNINILQTESSLANIIRILALSKSKKISSLHKILWRIKTKIGEGGYLHQFPR